MSTTHTIAPAAASYEELAQRFAPLFARIAEGALQRDLNRELPFEPVRWLDEAGFGALRVPAEHGGEGVSIEALTLLLVDLAAADSNVAHLYRSHLGFLETLRFQGPELQEYWYPRILAGKTVGNASTERGGNALGSLNTVLSQDAAGWSISGTKYYATGSIFSDYTRVSAALESGPGRRFAVVPTDAVGVTLEDDWDGFGQKLTGTGTAVFKDVRVEPAWLLDRVAGSPEATHEAAFFQLVLLAVLAGIAEAALNDAAVTVAGRARTFNTGSGVPFRDDPFIQAAVGRLSAKAFAARASVREAGRVLDQGIDAAAAAGALAPDFAGQTPLELVLGELAVEKAQVIVPELALAAAQGLFETVGASAVSTKKGLDRHWRNAQTVATHNPIAFRARAIGDYHVNGTLPEGLNAIGDAVKKPGA